MSPLSPGAVGRLTFAVDSVAIHFASFTLMIGLGVAVYALGGFGDTKAGAGVGPGSEVGPGEGPGPGADAGAARDRRRRFLLTALPTLAAVLGVVFAGDLLTLFLFFEALALLGFLLVRQGEGARAAAIRYFWTMLVGGLLLLAGILLHAGGAPAPGSVLLVAGFGVKAGMLPVHGWLPIAHSKAPAPASALLSGVMIKVGIYGIFRVLSDPSTPEVLHATVLGLGLAGAAYGALRALAQTDAKRLLAWSSVSQIGVILTGMGAGAWEGSLEHVLTHAAAKALLFLAVGAVALRCGTVHLARLGGLWRAMPVTFGLSLLASLALMGFPLLRAASGKGEIHHALEGLPAAETIFFLASAGTVAVLLKLIGGIFLGRAPDPDPAQAASAQGTSEHGAPALDTSAIVTSAIGTAGHGAKPVALGLMIVALPLLLPTLPADVPYFAGTLGVGLLFLLAARGWDSLRHPLRVPRIGRPGRLPRPSIPTLPHPPVGLEADLRRALDRYTRELSRNLALLFVLLLAAVLLLG